MILFRRSGAAVEVLLTRPGGPYWRRKDIGAWQIPKGAVEAGEMPIDAAFREVEEELGARPDGTAHPLGRIRQLGGKVVEAFAIEAPFEPADLSSMTFEMEWPPKSGRTEVFPEVEEARWFTMEGARERMLPSQQPLLDRLEEGLSSGGW
jgi:predicted NUDIX family NTP pyrophosphohydrolase